MTAFFIELAEQVDHPDAADAFVRCLVESAFGCHRGVHFPQPAILPPPAAAPFSPIPKLMQDASDVQLGGAA